LPSDPNPLKNNNFRPIPGRSLLLFVAVLAGLVALTVPFLGGLGPLPAVVALYIACLIAVGVAVAPLGPAIGPALALRPAPWTFLVLGPVVTVVLSVLVSQVGPEVESMKQMAELVNTPERLALGVVALAGLAPLAEELIFRGLLYGWVEGRWGARPAILVSAIAFALAHFEPTYMLLVLPLGVLFSWMRWRSNSLLPSFAAHVANNAFAVLSVGWFGG